MGRPELGTKCTCTECQERFYDLNRSPAICPKCGAQQSAKKTRTSRPPRSAGIGLDRPPIPAEALDGDSEPAGTPEAEAGDDVPDLDEETDGDIGIDPGRPQTTD